MSADAVVVGVIVAAAVAAVARQLWRAVRAARRPAANGCGDCGCGRH